MMEEYLKFQRLLKHITSNSKGKYMLLSLEGEKSSGGFVSFQVRRTAFNLVWADELVIVGQAIARLAETAHNETAKNISESLFKSYETIVQTEMVHRTDKL